MELLRKYNKLKASSLIESVIAMTIISVCILIAMTIYTMVLKSSNSITHYQSLTEKQKILNETKSNPELTNETFNYKNFIIEKKVSVHESIDGLLLVDLTAINKKDTLTSTHLIRSNKND